MKSPMVQNNDYIPDKEGYTDMQVCRSAAGYYVGTMYNNVEADGTVWQEPGSRDSDYFRTYEDAEKYLKLITTFNGAGTRDHP